MHPRPAHRVEPDEHVFAKVEAIETIEPFTFEYAPTGRVAFCLAQLVADLIEIQILLVGEATRFPSEAKRLLLLFQPCFAACRPAS